MKLGSKSSDQSLGAYSILPQSELYTSNLNSEMDAVYSIIQENDLCKYIILNYADTVELGAALVIGDIEFEGKEYKNVSLRYYLQNSVYFIEMKYDLDEYLRRFVTIQVENFNTPSETILLSYFDKIVNPLPYLYSSGYSIVKRANTTYSVQNRSLVHFRVYDQNSSSDLFLRYGKAFRISRVGQDYYFYSSDKEVIPDYTYEGQFYPEFIYELERTFAFVSTSDGYAGKAIGYSTGGFYFQYYNDDFDLILSSNLATLTPASDSMAQYGYPLKFIKAASSSAPILYDEDLPRLWIDTNNNGSFDNGEPKLQTDMEPLSQVCSCGIEVKSYPVFLTDVPYHTPISDVIFNYYNNPLFASFVYNAQSFLDTNRNVIKSALDDGIVNALKYDISTYPVDANPANVEW